jgi:hypothetical protein
VSGGGASSPENRQIAYLSPIAADIYRLSPIAADIYRLSPIAYRLSFTGKFQHTVYSLKQRILVCSVPRLQKNARSATAHKSNSKVDLHADKP